MPPTLQLLLTRMWDEARQRDRQEPNFNRALYADLKAKGYQLGEVLDQQLAAIREDDPEAVDRGMMLDLLRWFTTSLGTASAHTLADLQSRYPRQPPKRLESLLRLCQKHYLLTETGGVGGETAFRLTHDTLAPLIRDRYQGSMASVPHARRAIENKAAELAGWKNDRAGKRPVLEPNDQGRLENALAYLPAWTATETELVEDSRDAERRRLRHRRFWQGAGIAAVVLIAASALFATWQSFRLAGANTSLGNTISELGTTIDQRDRTIVERDKANDNLQKSVKREEAAKNEATLKGTIAQARLWTEQARAELAHSPPRALLLSAAAVAATAVNNSPEPSCEQALRELLQQVAGEPFGGAKGKGGQCCTTLPQTVTARSRPAQRSIRCSGTSQEETRSRRRPHFGGWTNPTWPSSVRTANGSSSLPLRSAGCSSPMPQRETIPTSWSIFGRRAEPTLPSG